MRTVIFKRAQLEQWQREKKRPEDYLIQLEKCAMATSGTDMIFDMDSDCWKELKARYANPANTIITAIKEGQQKAKAFAEHQKENQRRRSSGGCGCSRG